MEHEDECMPHAERPTHRVWPITKRITVTAPHGYDWEKRKQKEGKERKERRTKAD